MEYPLELITEYESGCSTVQLSQKYGIHYSSIRKFLIKNGITLRSNKTNSRKYAVDHEAFKNIDSEEKAYWLGFIYADGYVSSTNGKRVGLSIGIKDMQHMEKFKEFLKSDYPISTYVRSSSYGQCEYCRMIIASEQMYEDLVTHGACEHKTKILEYPTWMRQDLQRHFLRGYLDGDGCITKNGKNSYAVKILGTEQFIDGTVCFLRAQCNYQYGSRTLRRDGCPVQSLNMFGETAYEVLKLFYSDSKIWLDRKFDLAKSAMQYFSRLYQQ